MSNLIPNLDEKLEVRNFHIWRQIGVIFTILDFFSRDLQACKHAKFLEITSFGSPNVIFLIS